MQSFLEDLKTVKDTVGLSPEAKMQAKLKLVQFMESPVSVQEEMLSEFSEQSTTVEAPVSKVSVPSKARN